MKYQLLCTKGNYSLILRGKHLDEYAVVRNLNESNGTWAWTVSYYNFGCYTHRNQVNALASALEMFRGCTEENYIARNRLEELATYFKDGYIQLCEECNVTEIEMDEFFDEECGLYSHEKEFFEI